MTEMAPEPDPITKVARDLTEIEALHAQLPNQAQNDSNAHLMPGGRAMVALAPVANLERWEHMTATSDKLGRTYTIPDLEDDDDHAPATQLITYWAEQWRRIHGAEYGQRTTIATETNFIRYQLTWAWDNLDDTEWVAFAADIQRAKSSLESILYAGKRAQKGVPCLDCSVDLIRVSRDAHEPNYCAGIDGELCAWPHKFCPHDRGGLVDEWKCTGCDRKYDTESYFRAVHHAHFIHADYLPLDDAEARTGVKSGTIKVWATRGKVRRHKAPGATRISYCVADIETANGNPEEVA